MVSNVCLSLLVCACARSVPGAGDELFRRIQTHEQGVALGQAKLEEAEGCAEAREGARQVCDASRALCELARTTSDADALMRCTRAEDACRGAGERERTSCANSPPHERADLDE